MIIWLNNILLQASDARIDPADRGFTLGDGLFETIAVRGDHILRFESHLTRFKHGCEVLQLPLPAFDIADAIKATLNANHFVDAAVRVTYTRGATPRDLLPPRKVEPTMLISVSSLPESPPPARCAIATVTRRNEHSPLAHVKSLNYLDNILARQEAVARGAGEAILLNTAGRVAESCVANLFIVQDGRVITPPLKDGALPGVMRAAVLSTCNGIQSSLEVDDLMSADGIFLTNSLGIRPVVSIDGKPAPNMARAFIEDVRIKLAA